MSAAWYRGLVKTDDMAGRSAVTQIIGPGSTLVWLMVATVTESIDEQS